MYAQYKFLTTDKLERNLLSAVMTSFDFNGFEETSDALVGFIDNTLLSQDEVKAVLEEYGLAFIPFEYSTIEEVNWNESWEKNFSPIVIDDVCIRATFHEKSTSPTEIIIDPKMSFGTGHHETTSQMCELIMKYPHQGKKVLDMGSGTGILAIVAAKLGAASVCAVDTDEWAFNNIRENIQLNHVEGITPLMGDVSVVPVAKYDIIYANINLNVLKNDIPKYTGMLKKNGLLFLSGFYESDMEQILNVCKTTGLNVKEQISARQWVACVFA